MPTRNCAMNEQAIFSAALDIPSARDRAAYLDKACGGDPMLRQQVEALLSAHERSGVFLDVPACEQLESATSSRDAATVALPLAEGNSAMPASNDPTRLIKTQAE